MKKTLKDIRIFHPENSIRIKKILKSLQEELMVIIDKPGISLDLKENIEELYNNIEESVEEVNIDYGQVDLFEDIYPMGKDESINYKDYQVDTSIPHNLLENMTHKRPHGFRILNGDLVLANNWKDLYVKSCQLLWDMDSVRFKSFENKSYLNGLVWDYFSKENSKMDRPIKLRDNFYINANFDANSFRDMLIKLLKEYKINVKDFHIYLRADYGPYHRL